MKNLESVFNEQTLKHEEPEWVSHRRHNLFRQFSEAPMPREREEAWRYTHLEKVDVAGVEPKDFSPGISASNEVIFIDMRTAIEKHPDLVRKYFLLPNVKEDKVSLMQKAFWNNGVFLYVPKGVDAGMLSSKMLLDKDIMSYTLIILEEGASAKYFEETTGSAKLMTDITEIYLGDNSSLDFYVLQNANGNIFSNKNAFFGKDSRMQWVAGCFGGNLARLKIDNYFRNPGASAETNSFFVGSGRQHIDITTNAIHMAPNTTNNISNKGILRDNASSVYRGMIKIDKEAQKTISYLSDNTIMLGEKAIANSIPGLMIDANDVKASHGSTMGQVDESQLFYLRSRGLTKEQAEKLIIEGFIEPSLEAIKDENLRDVFRKIVEAKAS